MSRYIDAEEFERRMQGVYEEYMWDVLEDMPTADVVEVKHGKWTEKEVIHKEEAKDIIEEWQSCRCSVCGRYHTEPYMYYFSEPNYCSFCGADMREETEVLHYPQVDGITPTVIRKEANIV